MLSKSFPILLWLLFGFLYCTPVAWGQLTTATISGTITDETGAVLPGVEVTVTHVATRISRTVLSDDGGRYRTTNLNVGSYEVSAGLAGFQTTVRSGIELTIGREAVVDIALKVGEMTEKVTVTGEAPLVQTTSGSLGDVVGLDTIQQLPLNGRDLQTLLKLQPGVTAVSTGASGRAGFGLRMSVSGARPQDSSTLMDGTEAKGFDAGGVPAGISGSFLGGEGVQEFKVERNSYSAQFGGVSGGVMNLVSRTGTNEFHGSAYEYIRNDNLDAANFRDPAIVDSARRFVGKAKPEFKRNQYGFSLGGPIVKNRTFFFGNYEAFRERLGFTEFLSTLTPEARQGLLPNPATGQLESVPLNPEMIPYFALWPLPGPAAQNLGDGRAREPVTQKRPTDETLYSLRVDHQLSESDSIFGRWSRTAGEKLTIKTIPHYFTINSTRNVFFTIQETKIFSSQWLNTFRFGNNRRQIGWHSWEDPPSDPRLHYVPVSAWKAPRGAPPALGTTTVTGLSDVGIGATTDGWADNLQINTTYADDVAYNRGAHSLKFGFSWLNMHFNSQDVSRPGGNFTFSSIRDFLAGRPSAFRGDILPVSDPSYRLFRSNIIGWYVQDDWKVGPRLSLNLGFRHEFYTVPIEVDGEISNLRQPFTQKEVTLGNPWFLNPSLKSFMPRLGLAWDPTGSGKMAIRAGAGIFYNHIPTETYRQAGIRLPPFTTEINLTGVGNVPYPGTKLYDKALQLQSQGGLGNPLIFLLPFDWLRNSHNIQWNLNIQRELLAQTAVTIGYAGARGINLFQTSSINGAKASVINGRYVVPAGATVQNLFWSDSALQSQETSADSWYHGLQFGVQRRFHGGFQFQFSYTYSKTLDTASAYAPTFANAGGGQYYWDPGMRKGYAAFHVPRVITSNFVWQLPLGRGQRFGSNWPGWMNAILGGWQTTGILSLSDGPPHTITKSARTDMAVIFVPDIAPDLLPGASTSPVLGNPDQYFDPSGFVVSPARTMGNVGRNTLIAPGVANFDFSLSKDLKPTERVKVQFRAEFFNLFNRANFALPSVRVFDNRGRRVGGAGFISGTTTTARQIQFALRLVF